jgi:hypothetical protein
MTPARPPFTEGETLLYVPDLAAPATRWPVVVVSPEIWDRHAAIYCRQRREDGAPRAAHDYKAITHLFREAAP